MSIIAGQALSTRKDLLPDDIADELVKLQDKVPPFSADTARAIIEQELGQKISEVFTEFENTPLASASVAQVHTAVLPDGKQVIVKVLRPDVEARIHSDIGLLYENGEKSPYEKISYSRFSLDWLLAGTEESDQ